ncbi:GTP cyclohydrolase I FolE [Campylobacter hepaticus]|uniref:GTP cyclohydrolase 1 n=2 Tax=Campylobacter hepaticus TaxID=1813019 RepID=A0A6A7JSF0_9BACT|nr:GTP cyclohydrolase I FolE [Campylobacter hepaticus]AXP09088.1 GTP cyclohydrolase I FolE [Campylobacter hepaticus]MCZ0771579.1 GTP cyclohydrolase I FolE [Campylobacter hepaticus]MCZ0773047.1 GTP cyclohydrolase I FolE [Campylobacter hepaticus]MCZ0775727.1 GTP cyclohydrolase I FolE [Campylobacter hepaticus]MDX2323494.1 GTP cyclohydrolase I FolE [Campylobacter hepaticus]
MQEQFENCIKTMLEIIGENPTREGLIKTPNRVFKAYEFLTSGYKQNAKEILNDALFESSNKEMVLVRDIEFYSLCEHHLLPFFGHVHVAYIPDEKVVGLSKIPRIVEMYAKRLQLQEQLSEQIAQCLMENLNAKGVGVVIQARHMCVQMRGVQKINSTTFTSSLRGVFLEDEKIRKEFFELINLSKQVNLL